MFIFEAIVISQGFQEKSLVQRHQMVYDSLGDKMQSEIHALSLTTLTPKENSE